MYKEMLNWNIKQQIGYIRGFIDGEGTIIFGWTYKNKEKNYKHLQRTIRISNTNKKILITIRKMLESIGIKSLIYIDTRAGIRRATRDSWVLIIFGKENFVKFRSLIGFTEEWKKDALQKMISSYR